MPQCPNCNKPATEQHMPFCSKRCADVDLGRWLNESYTVPAVETDEDDEKVEENDDLDK